MCIKDASLRLNCFGVSASGYHAAISTFDDNLCECNPPTKFDHSTLTTNLFADFRGGNVANAHFQRHASFERIGTDYRYSADDVDYWGTRVSIYQYKDENYDQTQQ